MTQIIASARASERGVLAKEPPLGTGQALVMKALYELKDEACGKRVVEWIETKGECRYDVSQVYSSLRKLRSKGLISLMRSAKSELGGPPLKILKLTPKGSALLEETMAHYAAWSKLLS